jgi:hypothetical protein
MRSDLLQTLAEASQLVWEMNQLEVNTVRGRKIMTETVMTCLIV